MLPFSIEDIVGVHEIAERFGVAPETVEWAAFGYPAFPDPMIVLAIGALWYWPDVVDFTRGEWRRWGAILERIA